MDGRTSSGPRIGVAASCIQGSSVMRTRTQWPRRGRRAVILGVALALAVPGSAWADDLRNDLDDTEDVGLEVMNLTTSSGTTQIKVQPVSGDDETGAACNIDARESIVVA